MEVEGEARQARKMVDLDLSEASGVDLPAHLEDGWMVLKALDPEAAERVLDEARLMRVRKDDAPEDEEEDLEDEEEEDEDDDEEGGRADDLEAAYSRIDELEAQLEEAGVGVSKSASDPFSSLPEPVLKQMAEQEARIAEAERVAKAERDIRVDQEYVAKAKDLSHLAVDPGTLGRTLRSVAENAPDAFPEITRVLKAANAALSEGALFKSLGSDVPTPSSAEAQLNAMAEAEVAKSSNTSMADAQARILNTPHGAALYRQYQQEREAAIRNR